MTDNSYDAVMSRKSKIMLSSLGLDYGPFTQDPIAFDYEAMMALVPYTLDDVRDIQGQSGVGNTAMIEVRQLTRLARTLAPKGKGARIFVKDEAANPSGSYKARRAALSLHHAKAAGFKGVVSATTRPYNCVLGGTTRRKGVLHPFSLDPLTISRPVTDRAPSWQDFKCLKTSPTTLQTIAAALLRTLRFQ